jgi:hypothetical protein
VKKPHFPLTALASGVPAGRWEVKNFRRRRLSEASCTHIAGIFALLPEVFVLLTHVTHNQKKPNLAGRKNRWIYTAITY